MNLAAPIVLRGVSARDRRRAALLAAWFFLTAATLWLLKSLRIAALLAHLGAAETPYVQLASVAILAPVVLAYTRLVDGRSRIAVVRASHGVFAAVLVLYWLALRFGSSGLMATRPFVWALFILADLHAAVMVSIFWTYTNDVVTSAEANRLYGAIGLGGILGGAAGGALVDLCTRAIGPANLLLVGAALVACGGLLSSLYEARFRPPVRAAVPVGHGMASALAGARAVFNSRYLRLLVGVVIAYEVTATLTNYGVNVLFERTYHDEVQLARMYGRLGWLASGAAVISQLVLVPLLLPFKRIALVLPPVVIVVGVVGVVLLPVIGMAIVLTVADLGLNYSLQEATIESLYVPLPGLQKYKARAFIGMFVDRAAKAVGALVLLLVIARHGHSVRWPLVVSLGTTVVWLASARRLGRHWYTAHALVAPTASTDGVRATQPS